MNRLNPSLIKKAMLQARQKMAFVPADAGGDPNAGPGGAGGGAGMDPSGAVGPPPDPTAGAGMPPPMDQLSGGGAAPPPPPAPPSDASGVGGGPAGGDIAAQVSQGVAQALASSGLQGSQKPTAPKPDINTVATDIFQLKKMFLHFMRIQNIELPPDILDGPNRDPVTGAPAMGPSGGSDAQPGSSMQQAGGQAQSAIKPISPVQGAFPTPSGGGGMGKVSSARIGEEITGQHVRSKAAAVARMLRRRE